MKRDETDKVGRTFQEMARESKLQLAEYSPEIQSMIGETGTLKVSMLLKGDFFNLQPFLLQICRLPYLDTIEEITIKSASDTKEFRLRLLLARE